MLPDPARIPSHQEMGHRGVPGSGDLADGASGTPARLEKIVDDAAHSFQRQVLEFLSCKP